MVSVQENPLYKLCQQWLVLLQEAEKQKNERFTKYANETYKFYNGAHNWMWKSEYARAENGFLDPESNVTLPRFMMSISKVSDAVDLFGPSLMHQYPEVLVSPVDRPPMDPMFLGLDPNNPDSQIYLEQIMQQQFMDKRLAESIASHKQHYLNWLQVRAGKKEHARRAITDAIVKGAGYLITELYTPNGTQIAFPRSRFVSCDNIIKDPDARNPDEVTWIAVKCTAPINMVEAQFPYIKPGSLKGHLQSKSSQATPEGKAAARSGLKTTHDLLVYYKIYSKNGFGQRMRSINSKDNAAGLEPGVREIIDSWGDYTYTVVARNIPYPLNIPPDLWKSGDQEAIFRAAQWPIPFWRDDGSNNDWPVTELIFREDPEDVWGVSIFKPAISWIRLANWALSFLADKMATNACDYVAVAKAAVKDLREGIASQSGPFKLIELETSTFGDDVRKVIQILEKPPFDIAIWNMVKEIFNEIDKATGLSGLLYGISDRQMRSATEASAMSEGSTIRPADMSAKCDQWYADAALKEMQAACWLLNGQDAMPALGPQGAKFWDDYIRVQDFAAVARDYRYELVANSARKHNRAANLRALLDLGQVITPAMQAYAMQGIVGPWNWYAQSVAKELEIKIDGALLPEPPAPPQPDPNAPPPPPSPEEIRANAEQQKALTEQQKNDLKAQAAAQDLQIKQAQAVQALQQTAEQHALEMKKQYDTFRNEMVRSQLDLAMLTRKLQAMQRGQQGVGP